MASKTPAIAPPSFDVKVVSPFAHLGTYRVFVERGDLLFIQFEGGKLAMVGVIAPFLGPLGGLIPLGLWLLGKSQDKGKKERLETNDPEQLLRDNEANFKLNIAEIRHAAMEAPAFFTERRNIGRLNFFVRHGEKIKCEFADAVQMKQAIQLLVPLLNATLAVNVEWDAKAGRFKKKKKHQIHQNH